MSTVLEAAPVAAEPTRTRQPAVRNVAVDAYRGFVMLLMMGEVSAVLSHLSGFSGELVLENPGL